MTSAVFLAVVLSAGSTEGQPPTDRERSLKAFATILSVLKSPRCLNCHPSDDVPHQGDEQRLHGMGVERGADDHGGPVQPCSTCHQTANHSLANVPGAPRWGLAPRSMAWLGKSDFEIARRLLDLSTNGGRTPAQLVRHLGTDPLVLWAWSPGPGRQLPPVGLDQWRRTLQVWLETGAAIPLPPSSARP